MLRECMHMKIWVSDQSSIPVYCGPTFKSQHRRRAVCDFINPFSARAAWSWKGLSHSTLSLNRNKSICRFTVGIIFSELSNRDLLIVIYITQIHTFFYSKCKLVIVLFSTIYILNSELLISHCVRYDTFIFFFYIFSTFCIFLIHGAHLWISSLPVFCKFYM